MWVLREEECIDEVVHVERERKGWGGEEEEKGDNAEHVEWVEEWEGGDDSEERRLEEVVQRYGWW